jgi:hypothetical protein
MLRRTKGEDAFPLRASPTTATLTFERRSFDWFLCLTPANHRTSIISTTGRGSDKMCVTFHHAGERLEKFSRWKIFRLLWRCGTNFPPSINFLAIQSTRLDQTSSTVINFSAGKSREIKFQFFYALRVQPSGFLPPQLRSESDAVRLTPPAP